MVKLRLIREHFRRAWRAYKRGERPYMVCPIAQAAIDKFGDCSFAAALSVHTSKGVFNLSSTIPGRFDRDWKMGADKIYNECRNELEIILRPKP